MTLGAFACILSMRRDGEQRRRYCRACGPRQNRSAAWRSILALLMFSLAGIPPLAGFWAKWYVVPAGHQGRALSARRHRRCGQRRRRLLLSAHRQDHVLRRGGRRPSSRATARRLRSWRCRRLFVVAFVLPFIGGTLSMRRRPRPRRSMPACTARSAMTRVRHRIIHLAETGSTNTDAMRLALKGEALPLWVIGGAADGGARPGGADLGVAAGQSLCQPRFRRAAPLNRQVNWRSSPELRFRRHSRNRACAQTSAAAQMAE